MAVAPIAVPGTKAGEVYIPSLGKSFQQIELREGDVYDTIVVNSGAIVAGAEYVLFRDLAGKNEQHTNLTVPGRISAGDEAAIFRIGAHPRGCLGNQIPLFSDIKKLAENGTLRVQFNRRMIVESPIITFQSGYGLGGYSDETGATAVTIGVPSAAAAPTLFVPQQLKDDDDLTKCRFRFPDASAWLVSPAYTGTAYVAATPGTAVALTCFLHGVLKAPLGK